MLKVCRAAFSFFVALWSCLLAKQQFRNYLLLVCEGPAI